MEGKAMIMKYLGGVDSVAICVDSKGPDGKNSPEKLIEFVKMLQHSFGAVNLEDISQPNCFKVLDELREACDIPVWHDDAQGTACVTLAGLLNALKLAGKKIGDAKIVLLGAGASNTTIARLILTDGGDPNKMVVFDTKGSMHLGREDIKGDKRNYRKWELCEKTNPNRIPTIAEALHRIGAGGGQGDEHVRAFYRFRYGGDTVGVGLFAEFPFPVVPLVPLDIFPSQVHGTLGVKDHHLVGVSPIGHDEPGDGGVGSARAEQHDLGVPDLFPRQL
jgi:hypothetical protein